MSGKRQKSQCQGVLPLAFPETFEGEFPRVSGEGTEPFMAGYGPESQASDERLMEAVCEPENVERAMKRVMANKGSPGVDGVRVDDLPKYLAKQWPTMREQLLAGTYKPSPVKRVEIPKSSGGVRELGIPTVPDRFVQQAILQVLQPEWDPTFSAYSFGFRPGRSAHQAIAQAQKHQAEGYRFVVDMDLEKFFDRVNHDKLMGELAKRVKDKRMLRVIRAFLNAGVMKDGLVSWSEEGTPQGGPLSPLLSNIVLDALDRELESRGHRFVRYADDCNIYVRSKRAGQRVLESISRFVTDELKLRVNEEKSAVGRPWQRKFLGFSFTWEKPPRRRIAPESEKRFRASVRERTRRSCGKSLLKVIEELSEYLNGWRAYFGFCEAPSVLRRLDGWVRRRLRSLIWTQWKTGRQRYKKLRKRGIAPHDARKTAGSQRGPWRLANSPAVRVALCDQYLSELGLPTLAPEVTP
jgi:RNA-directed DNA polymerase